MRTPQQKFEAQVRRLAGPPTPPLVESLADLEKALRRALAELDSDREDLARAKEEERAQDDESEVPW